MNGEALVILLASASAVFLLAAVVTETIKRMRR
jgi:hypothetical protein